MPTGKKESYRIFHIGETSTVDIGGDVTAFPFSSSAQEAKTNKDKKKNHTDQIFDQNVLQFLKIFSRKWIPRTFNQFFSLKHLFYRIASDEVQSD
jgi:hypothetical protein